MGDLKPKNISRRRFLAGAVLASPFLAMADAKWLEPGWVKVRRLRLCRGKPAHRFVHCTDIHHKGDRAYFQSVVKKINEQSPEFVCFTGDLIEEAKFLPEALELIKNIKSPVYGVPGNHDFWSKAPFAEFARGFAATGGAWLLDQTVTLANGAFSIIGDTCFCSRRSPLDPVPLTRNIFLMHYPAWVKKLGDTKYDLMLAGHSHGGQVRFPFFGAVHLPWGVDQFDLGLFHTTNGPLYVNPGIGWFPVPIRFNCRPEITVFEL
jgi:predicted MPP superfamily phosphohydrolase